MAAHDKFLCSVLDRALLAGGPKAEGLRVTLKKLLTNCMDLAGPVKQLREKVCGCGRGLRLSVRVHAFRFRFRPSVQGQVGARCPVRELHDGHKLSCCRPVCGHGLGWSPLSWEAFSSLCHAHPRRACVDPSAAQVHHGLRELDAREQQVAHNTAAGGWGSSKSFPAAVLPEQLAGLRDTLRSTEQMHSQLLQAFLKELPEAANEVRVCFSVCFSVCGDGGGAGCGRQGEEVFVECAFCISSGAAAFPPCQHTLK